MYTRYIDIRLNNITICLVLYHLVSYEDVYFCRKPNCRAKTYYKAFYSWESTNSTYTKPVSTSKTYYTPWHRAYPKSLTLFDYVQTQTFSSYSGKTCKSGSIRDPTFFTTLIFEKVFYYSRGATETLHHLIISLR